MLNRSKAAMAPCQNYFKINCRAEGCFTRSLCFALNRPRTGVSMRRLVCIVAALAVIVLAVCGPAAASVIVHIDRSTQRMSVVVDGVPRYNWRISTARAGYITPPGNYHPEMLARRWFSKRYYNSPMPHSIFFYRGYAIHGTYEISRLGGPASHGCVRLDPGNAAILFGLVEREGTGRTTIVGH